MEDVVTGPALDLVVAVTTSELVVGLVVQIIGRQDVVTRAGDRVLSREEHVIALIRDRVRIRVGTIVEPRDDAQMHQRAVRALTVVDRVISTRATVERVRAVTGRTHSRRRAVSVDVVLVQDVVPVTADNAVITVVAGQVVITAATTQEVVVGVTADRVITGRTDHTLDTGDEVEPEPE